MVPPIRIHEGLALYSDGRGETVLLIPSPHACTVGPEIDKPLARLLVATGYRVLTFDPPGAFRSTRLPSVSMDEMIGCAQETLRIADVRTPVLVCGHSMASVCAIGLALERPTIASSLLLVGTTTGPRAALRYGGMPRCWHLWSPSFWTFNIRGIRLGLGIGNLAVQKRLCAQTIQASYVNKQLVPSLEVESDDHRLRSSARATWATKIGAIDYEPRLAELRMPVLVCAGRHDPQTTLRANERVVSGIPGARIVVFERSGHYPFVEEAEEFARVVCDFWGANILAS